MTQKVPQKVLDKVGDCGWRAEFIQRANLSGLQREDAGPSEGHIQSHRLGLQKKKKNMKKTFTHTSVSLQVTGMIPVGHMGDPEGEH